MTKKNLLCLQIHVSRNSYFLCCHICDLHGQTCLGLLENLAPGELVLSPCLDLSGYAHFLSSLSFYPY